MAARRDAAVRRRDWGALAALLAETPLSDKRVRERLVIALERLAFRGSVPTLERIALDDREGKYVRVAALEALAKIAEPASLPIAIALLTSAPPRVRQEAAELLGTLGGDEAEQALIDALQAEDAGAHAAAADALGRLKSTRAVPLLGERLHATSRMFVRQESALALHRIGTSEARERLASGLSDARLIARWRMRRWVETMQ